MVRLRRASSEVRLRLGGVGFLLWLPRKQVQGSEVAGRQAGAWQWTMGQYKISGGNVFLRGIAKVLVFHVQ